MVDTGMHVPVPTPIALNDLTGTLKSNVTKTWDMVDKIFLQLNASLLNLKETVGEYESKLDDLDLEFGTMDRPQFPANPGFARLILDSSYPDGYIPDPNYRELGTLDFNFVAPSPPQEVSEGFSWISGGTYTSDNWTTLISLVQTRMLTGNYGLSAEAHAALVAMEQEARRRNQEREMRNLVRAAGARGFNLPGGRVADVLMEVTSEVLKRDQDALNNITNTSFNLANDREKFFVGTATDIEKTLVDVFDKAENRSLEAAKAAKEYVWKFFSENIRLFLGKFEGEKLRLEGLKTKIEAITSANKNETDKYLGAAQVLEARIRAITEKNRGMVDARKGEVETYGAEVEAVKNEYLALVEELRVNNDAMAKQIDREIAMEGVKLSAFNERSKMLQAIGLGVSQIWSQGLASTVGALNWSLSNTYTGHESNGVSLSADVRESHSYSYNEE